MKVFQSSFFMMNWVRSKLNILTSVISPPPDDPTTPRKRILLIHCHPKEESLSTFLLLAIERSLASAQHEVRVRHLYGNKNPQRCYPSTTSSNSGGLFYPILSATEKTSYSDVLTVEKLSSGSSQAIAKIVPKDVAAAIDDLRWCDSLIFVYPTWWSSFPAVLKGYFDRVYRPGVAMTFTSKSSFLSPPFKPNLTNIKKIGVVTTYASGFAWYTYLIGDLGRCFISRSMRYLCAPGCQLLWISLYDVTKQDATSMEKKVEEAFKTF